MTDETPDPGNVYVDGVRVFARYDAARQLMQFMIRATDRETFLTKAAEVGILVDDGDGQRTASGVAYHEMGPLLLKSGEFDADMNVVVPPVVDSRWHVNLWLQQSAIDAGNWQQWAKAWTENGQVAQSNANEVAVIYQGVELIDPMTVSSPSNVLL